MKTKSLFLTAIAVIVILLISCASLCNGPRNKADFNTVQGKTWQLIRVEMPGNTMELDRERINAMYFENMFTLIFNNNIVSGRAAPNNYSGQIMSLDGNKISFSQLISTRMALLTDIDVPIQEDDYFHLLQRTTAWGMERNNLVLYTVDNANRNVKLIYSLK
ncbi:MAG: META domain-containing protein [Spirochaetaceae bacterium]|nr:META domain-containing protein [Spirochaetaceae bacterium]